MLRIEIPVRRNVTPFSKGSHFFGHLGCWYDETNAKIPPLDLADESGMRLQGIGPVKPRQSTGERCLHMSTEWSRKAWGKVWVKVHIHGQSLSKDHIASFSSFFFTRGHRGGTRAETQVRGQVQRFCPPRWPLSPHYDGLPIHRSSFKLNWHAPETKFANVPINAYLSATYHYERSTRMSVFLRTCNAWKWRDVQ